MNKKAILLFAICILVSAGAQASTGTKYKCGDTVTENYTMTEDLDCNGDGLIVKAENITIDCNGHTITGSWVTGTGTTSFGIKPARNTLVKGCRITKFSGAVAGYGYFSVEDSELYGNGGGIGTVGMAGPSKFLRNNIHHNERPITLDETLNVEIGYNHIHDNKEGIKPFLQVSWSEDFNYWPRDNGNIHDNLIERNGGIGIDFYQSYSQVRNNIIRYNKSGLSYTVRKVPYRIWVGSNVVDVEGWEQYGKKRTNHNIISGNQIYGNTEYDFKIFWWLESEYPASGIRDFADFENTIENNIAGGKPFYFFFQQNNLTQSGLDADKVYCVQCKNASISNSTIRDLYLLDTNDSTFTNLTLQGGEYGIGLYSSHRNTFSNYTITNTKYDIFKSNSTGNVFNGSDCIDNDADDVCNEFDNCNLYNPDQRDSDKDGVGDICQEKQIGCIADLNGDGKVMRFGPGNDMIILWRNIKRTDCSPVTNWCELADLDRDGNVDATDFNIFSQEVTHPLAYLGCDCSKTQELCDEMDNDCDSITDEGCQQPPQCNNGVIDANENCSNCPQDVQCSADEICCNATCIEPECNADSECDDLNAATTDTCNAPNTCNANCTHTPTAECIDNAKLSSNISEWKQGRMTMPALMQTLRQWKAGTGC